MKFGEYLREHRRNQRKTLREFCISNQLDPGLWSKLERGKIPPPKCKFKLDRIAEYLNIQEDKEDCQVFYDLAEEENGRIVELITDEELVEKLPIFFQTQRSSKVSDEIEVIIKIIKEVEDGY